MKPIYYSAAWTDSGFLLGCSHEHETIVEAVSCIPCAGGYVISVENGVTRSLKPHEEAEFKNAIQDSSKYPAPHPPALAVPETASSKSGYAVMTRIRLVDGWSWATWMCFATREQAMAHARKGDRVARFSSGEWSALKQEKSLEPPQTDPPPIHSDGAEESLDARAEGESLIEFVVRLLGAFDQTGIASHECQEECPVTSESDKETALLETPTHMARLILSRLSDSEIRKLNVLSQTDIPALLEALQLCLPTVINDGWGQ
jgi:hypothetical protein